MYISIFELNLGLSWIIHFELFHFYNFNIWFRISVIAYAISLNSYFLICYFRKDLLSKYNQVDDISELCESICYWINDSALYLFHVCCLFVLIEHNFDHQHSFLIRNSKVLDRLLPLYFINCSLNEIQTI